MLIIIENPPCMAAREWLMAAWYVCHTEDFTTEQHLSCPQQPVGSPSVSGWPVSVSVLVPLNCWVMSFWGFFSFIFFTPSRQCCFCLNTTTSVLDTEWEATDCNSHSVSRGSAGSVGGLCWPVGDAPGGQHPPLDVVNQDSWQCCTSLLFYCHCANSSSPLPLLLVRPYKVTVPTFLRPGPQVSLNSEILAVCFSFPSSFYRRLAERSSIWDQFLVASRCHASRRQTGCSLQAPGLCWALSALPTEADTVKVLPVNIRLPTAQIHCNTRTWANRWADCLALSSC